MEIESSIRRYVLGLPVVAAVGQKVFKFRLEELIDGTGSSAIVINRGAGWASPDPVKSTEFPRLIIDAVSDPTRDDTGAITTSDAADKAFAVARQIIPWFTFPNLRGEYIGAVGSNPGLYVVSSQQWAEPRLISLGDLHGTAVLNEQAMGDTLTVRTEFALQIIHAS
jgi:hypothetical protein